MAGMMAAVVMVAMDCAAFKARDKLLGLVSFQEWMIGLLPTINLLEICFVNINLKH